MNAKITEIMNADATKTAKIQQLILLGLTRRQVADLITDGNYGFVQNVYAKMLREGRLNHTAVVTSVIEETMRSGAFDKDFGVEFEAYSVDRAVLRDRLIAAGIRCETEDYSHSAREYWKIVRDGSLTGNQAFELVSPILHGEAGMNELMKVCDVLNRCGAKVNKSCGTHVHINARDFSLDHWKRIYINFVRFES